MNMLGTKNIIEEPKIICLCNLRVHHGIATYLMKIIRRTCQQCSYSCKSGSESSIKNSLLKRVGCRVESGGNKVSVIGLGNVGVACAIGILAQKISTELALVDQNKNVLMGEALDLQHGSVFLNSAKISASTEYDVCHGSKICVITAGARQKEGETRLDLLHRNAEIMKNIVSKVVPCCPDAIFIIVSNPVDIMAYVAWKVSKLPQTRVIGSGTNLDSARFRFFISQKLGVASESCHGWIIGEHGDSSVPVWSGTNVSNTSLAALNPNIGAEDDPENWREVHKRVVSSAYEVIKLKGYTAWAVGMSVADLVKIIMNNSERIRPVSVYAKGFYGIEDDVFLSLPVVLGENGVYDVVKQNLSACELDLLRKSASTIAEVQKKVLK